MSKYVRRVVMVMGTVGMCAPAALAGPLTPPPGAVAPTMKTLEAIEPRVLLRDVAGNAESVHRITAPGQYVATADIVVPSGKHGAVIDLSPGVTGQVTIDLNGFGIQGQPGSLDGVRKDGAFTSADFGIFNGRIVGMGGDGVHIEHLGGADISVTILECAGDGIDLLNVPEATAVAINSKAPPPGAGNIVKGMGGHGVRATGCGNVTIDYTVADCALDGVLVENADRCDLSFDVSRCAGNGVTVTGCPEVLGMATIGTNCNSSANHLR